MHILPVLAGLEVLAPGGRPDIFFFVHLNCASNSISAPGVLLVPAFRDLGLWEGMGGSSISLFALCVFQLEDNCSSVFLLVVGTFFIVLSVVQPLSTFVTVGGCWNRQEPSWLQLQLRL